AAAEPPQLASLRRRPGVGGEPPGRRREVRAAPQLAEQRVRELRGPGAGRGVRLRRDDDLAERDDGRPLGQLPLVRLPVLPHLRVARRDRLELPLLLQALEQTLAQRRPALILRQDAAPGFDGTERE